MESPMQKTGLSPIYKPAGSVILSFLGCRVNLEPQKGQKILFIGSERGFAAK
jgi:hypothetical protein